MRQCNAAWYELNISAPENDVSACCYYAGAKDPWLDLISAGWGTSDSGRDALG